jgi:peptidoglycan/LPS O-acetylase OafA/YrhL
LVGFPFSPFSLDWPTFLGTTWECWGVTWSLAVEEQFYWLWPATLRFLLSVRQGKFLLPAITGLIFSALALRAGLRWNGVDPGFLYMFTLTRMDSLFMGALAVVISGIPEVQRAIGLLARFRLPEVILIGWASLLQSIHYSTAFLSYGGSTLIAFFFGVFLLCMVFQERKTFLLLMLESHAARWLGKRSYAIYLYHVPVLVGLDLFRVKHNVFSLILITTLRFVMPVVLAALSYRYIEMPFLRKKSLLHWRQQSAPETA